jgi:prephenate dehydrogenase
MTSLPRVGIIGGTGKIGSWFARFFAERGYPVLVSGRRTSLTNAGLVRDCTIVIVSVPIASTVDVIREIAPLLRSEQLVMDLTSLKEEPVSAMLASAAEVIGLHPLFNEHAKGLQGQTMAFCPARAPTWEEPMSRLFSSAGAHLKTTTATEHDRMMAIVQGVLHFNLISLGHAFRDLGVDLHEALAFMGPIYRMRFDMVGRILAQDPLLYAQIELRNPHTEEVISRYENSVRELSKIVHKRDEAGFIAYFSDASAYFGSLRDEAMKHTDAMVEQAVRESR